MVKSWGTSRESTHPKNILAQTCKNLGSQLIFLLLKLLLELLGCATDFSSGSNGFPWARVWPQPRGGQDLLGLLLCWQLQGEPAAAHGTPRAARESQGSPIPKFQTLLELCYLTIPWGAVPVSLREEHFPKIQPIPP